jgi:recombinational DNA repair ATPase RecF
MSKTKLRVERLDITGFRGVSLKRSLIFDGKSVLLFGENGTGKSTFVDALDKIFTGEIFTLDHRGQGISSQRFGPHIKGSAIDISLVFDDAKHTTFSINTDLNSCPDEVREYLQIAQTPVYILRRTQVLQLVESQPRERYEFLKPYLVLTEIEQVESTLRASRERYAQELLSKKSLLARHTDDLRRYAQVPNSFATITESALVTTLNSVLSEVGITALERLSDTPAAIAGLNSQLSQFGDLSRVTTLKTTIEALDELRTYSATSMFSELEANLNRLGILEGTQTSIIYEKVLEDGAKWIETESRTECPLCEQDMVKFAPSEVVERARARLEHVRELVGLRESVRRGISTLASTLENWQGRIGRVKSQLDKIEFDGNQEIGKELDAVAISLMESAQSLRRATTLNSTPDSEIAPQLRHSGALQSTLARVGEALSEQLKRLPSADAAQKLLTLRDKLTRTTEAWVSFTRTQGEVTESEKLASISEALHSSFERTRKEAIGELFNTINKDINDIYFELHRHHEIGTPDKASHRNVRLEVRDAVQQSVNLRADFYTETGDPRGYYSDAHLDTLGISIFLALRRWYRDQYPSFNLLVLDDVLSSIDSSHAVRLAEVLLTQFSDYQILLTTHDRLWFEHLRDIQSRCGVGQNFVNKSIYGWDIEEGPDLREPFDEHRYLVELVKTGQPFEMASTAGRLLEHILQEMRYSLRLSVPAKPGERYEIGDLWPPFYREIKKNYRSLYAKAQNALDALDVRWPLRNWIGAHFNNWAQNAPKSVLQEFAKSVLHLFDAVYCSDCRRFVTPSTTPLGQLACRKGHKVYAAPGKAEASASDRESLITSTAGSLRDAKLTTEIHLEWKKSERANES